jgi:aspartate/methionine/tyrosine aminotransferase
MLADRVSHFSESVIREMTRLAQQFGALNLGQGMPDFESPQEIKDAACKAIQDGFNQYSITWGTPPLRKAIVEKMQRFNGIPCDPDRNVTVCCGATECMMATMLALINPGDEVIIFQPFYENYGPDAIISGAKPVWVALNPPDWKFDPEELKRAFSDRTKAIIINTPNNPTGHIYTQEELSLISELCQKHNACAITDEIYEYIRFNEKPHLSLATFPGMEERTITISGLSKTFSVTGWRLGYCIAPPEISNGIRKAHDFLTVGAPHPLQMAGVAALNLPESYYEKLKTDYKRRRDLFLPYLREAGFEVYEPEGAYYVMTDIAKLGWSDDTEFVKWMIREIGVSAVPGSSFYSPKGKGRTKVRFMFAKKDDTLIQAGERLKKISLCKKPN